ncbi:AAA family ATPase [Clostridium tagluense]|uniref:Uncharacterized protein n=1 Tax=Clostridium tagluense TaxID=360422 RepID=A0A401UST1_9CLOT|nr:AAA family ATPase [Clostridium tagluense]GCD12597.1 hypothetical protein Ctaglu_42200 [Clostridium tagluense]
MKKAILTMGLPASGKSTVLNNLGFLNGDYTNIDPDLIKAEKLDYDPKQPQVYHSWSQVETKKRIAMAIIEEKNIIIDGTGTNTEKMAKYIRDLQVEGYEVTLLYVKVSLKTSLERNSKRERNVPEEIIREKFETMAISFEILSSMGDIIKVVDNN